MTFRVSGPWNVCCLACRNPGEHLKLDGLERAGSLGGRHSFHLFVLAVVTLKSAPGFQPVFHISRFQFAPMCCGLGGAEGMR